MKPLGKFSILKLLFWLVASGLMLLSMSTTKIPNIYSQGKIYSNSFVFRGAEIFFSIIFLVVFMIIVKIFFVGNRALYIAGRKLYVVTIFADIGIEMEKIFEVMAPIAPGIVLIRMRDGGLRYIFPLLTMQRGVDVGKELVEELGRRGVD